MQHSNLIGGSTCERAIACHGSIGLEHSQVTSPAAARGTALHEAMEYILLNDADPATLLGQRFGEVTIDEPMLEDALTPALDQFNAFAAEVGLDEYAVEQSVGFTGPLEGVYGTADILGRTRDGKVVCLDWKFGGMPVDPQSPQFKFYLAAGQDTIEVADLYKQPTGYIGAVIQPARLQQAAKVDITQVDLDSLRVALTIAKSSAGPDATRYPGRHCQYCPAHATCKERLQSVQAALRLDPADAKEVAKALAMRDEIKQWLTNVEATAHEQLERGVDIPGYKLVAKRATRKWQQSPELVAMLEADLGDMAYAPRKLATPPQVEKLYKKEKKLDFTKYDSMIAKVSSGTTIAAESDARNAVVVTSTAITEMLKGN